MQVTVNGEVKEFFDGMSVNGIVEALGLQDFEVAVERNRAIIQRDHWTQTVVAEGDQLEIVHFVGGG